MDILNHAGAKRLRRKGVGEDGDCAGDGFRGIPVCRLRRTAGAVVPPCIDGGLVWRRLKIGWKDWRRRGSLRARAECGSAAGGDWRQARRHVVPGGLAGTWLAVVAGERGAPGED
jgi:hypothetical protein